MLPIITCSLYFLSVFLLYQQIDDINNYMTTERRTNVCSARKGIQCIHLLITLKAQRLFIRIFDLNHGRICQYFFPLRCVHRDVIRKFSKQTIVDCRPTFWLNCTIFITHRELLCMGSAGDCGEGFFSIWLHSLTMLAPLLNLVLISLGTWV